MTDLGLSSLNNRQFFLVVLELGSPRPGLLLRPPFLACRWLFPVSSQERRGVLVSLPVTFMTPIPSWRSTLKASSPNTVPLGVSTLHMILMGGWGRCGKHSVQFNSVAQLCPTLCDPVDCSTPGLPVYHQLPEFTQTHGH